MKTKYLHITLISVLAIFIGITAFRFDEGDGPQKHKQLIKFSHKFHLENYVDCVDCHTAVPDATNLNDSLLPTMDDCGECHDIEDEDNCNKCHYKDIQEEFPEEKKSEVKFNHKFHLDNQKLKCTDCHTGLDKVDYAQDVPTALPSMESCTTCHTSQGPAPIECSNCHISTANLMPEDHKVADFIRVHKFEAKSNGEKCETCHSNNFCENCHAATVGITESNSKTDFYTPYSPYKFKDDVKQQQITFKHDLNYVYNHGVDARLHKDQCQTCHQTETFCAKCHSADGQGDYALGGVVPFSHTQPNFTTVGVGSGGGLHAQLAQKDIESCAACHDVEGGDANCVLCHNDSDGIKGTNPQTHPAGFMQDTHGDWHNDDGSVCFNCHTSTHTPGVGFCGYCHSSNPGD